MKPMKKAKAVLFSAAAVLLLAVIGVSAGYRYLLGNMERDRFVSPEMLSAADTSGIVRETMPETTQNGILDEDGNIKEFRLPEEALAVLRGNSVGSQSEDTSAETEEAPPAPETESETIPEAIAPLETESLPETEAETKPQETKALSKPAETVPKETKAPETKPAETPETEDPKPAVSYLKKEAGKIKTVVLYGLDKKTSSDVIMLAALDPVHNKCKLISLARDTYVYIAEKKAHTKLTYAYSMGGASLAVKTLNENFHLHLQDYVSVGFDQLVSVIDLLGGATVDISEKELEYMGDWEGLSPGLNHLDGRQALKYSRIRRIDNDLVRNDRQREVIASVFSSLRAQKITDYPALIREAAGMCTTSLTDAELISLATTFFTMKNCTFEQYNFPNAKTDCWSGLIDEQYYFVYDLAKVSDEIYRILYEDLYVSGYDRK